MQIVESVEQFFLRAFLARNELKQFIEGLKEGENSFLPAPTPQENEKKALPEPPSDEDKTILLLGELKSLLEGNALSPSLNGQAKGCK